MRFDVTMPQMGESIAEGTITRWIKRVGEAVQRDEPLFEISTDKVDAEIPSPTAGILVEIRRPEGETVPINDVVAVVETEAGAEAAAGTGTATGGASEAHAAGGGPAVVGPGAAAPEPVAAAPVPSAPAPPGPPGLATAGDPAAPRVFVSPVVRRIAAEHGLDPTRLDGTGAGGRVTKKDVLAFLAAGGGPATTGTAAEAPGGAAVPATPPPAVAPAPATPPARGDQRVERVPMSVMRRRIAEHMVASRRTSAHVHSVFEVDLSRVVELRERHKRRYDEQHGTKLTFTPFFIQAACAGLRAWPVINASVDGDTVVYKKDLNIGVAVALDRGLIVPVVRNADELSLAGLSKRVNDLAERARGKKLNPDEVRDGTFTITNPGIYGGLYGLPIINQPQVAILGVGGIEKRPVVVNDAIAIRPMVYLSMSYDHRVVDGAVADQFLALLKKTLQGFDEALL